MKKVFNFFARHWWYGIGLVLLLLMIFGFIQTAMKKNNKTIRPDLAQNNYTEVTNKTTTTAEPSWAQIEAVEDGE